MFLYGSNRIKIYPLTLTEFYSTEFEQVLYDFVILTKSQKNNTYKHSSYVLFQITNYAATAGATRATGRDSPAARSRGKL